MATEEIIAKYKLDIEDLQAKVRVIEAELLKTETAAKKAGEAGTAAVKKTAGEANLAEQAFNKLGAAIVAAFSVNAIINFGKASIKSFQEAELSAKKLQVAVGVSGGLQKDFDNLIKQSKELQKIGIFSDEAIQGVQTAALQFGLTAREVEKLVPIVADFASATGQDLTSAMDAVLRGIEGQERGLKKHSVTLIEGATRVENLDRISQQLSKTFDGQAKIVGETSAGAFAKLNNQMDEMQERIGERLAPRLGKLKFILTGIAEELLKIIIPESEQEKVDKMADSLTEFLRQSKSSTELLQQERIAIAAGIPLLEVKLKTMLDIGDATKQEVKDLEFRIVRDKAYNIALNNIIEERTKKEEELSGIRTRDAEDAAKKAAELSAKQLEQDKKDAEELDKAAEDAVEFAFKSLENQLTSEKALRITNMVQTGETLEQIEISILEKRLENHRKFAKDTSALELEIANKGAKKLDIHPNDEEFKEIEKLRLASEAKALKDEEENAKRIKDIKIQIAEETARGIADILFASAAQENQIEQDKISEQLTKQENVIDAEIAALEKRNQRGLISDKQLEKEKKKLEDKKIAAQLEAEKKINALKHEQDVANQQRALFDIAIQTAKNIVTSPALIGYWIALGAAQAAIVLASPLPKYYKGTAALERGGNAIGRDTIPILANEGEAIIPTDVNRKYPGLASAWIKNDLDRYILNQFVSPALTKQKEVHERLIQDRMAVINEDSLSRKIAAELEYRLRGDKVVGISNDSIKKLAGVISSDYNPRRV